MEISGFEPEASRMQSERSTTELYPRPDDKEQLILFISCLHHRDGVYHVISVSIETLAAINRAESGCACWFARAAQTLVPLAGFWKQWAAEARRQNPLFPLAMDSSEVSTRSLKTAGRKQLSASIAQCKH